MMIKHAVECIDKYCNGGCMPPIVEAKPIKNPPTEHHDGDSLGNQLGRIMDMSANDWVGHLRKAWRDRKKR